MLIAQNDDGELLEWLANARERGGHFISSLARAALVADWENYPLLRPVLVEMRKKYPAYEPSDAVKEELRLGRRGIVDPRELRPGGLKNERDEDAL
jgi:hypothetical protein